MELYKVNTQVVLQVVQIEGAMYCDTAVERIRSCLADM
jgi:hypothetical protein